MPLFPTSDTVLTDYLNTLTPLEHLLLDIPAGQFNKMRQAVLIAMLDAALMAFTPAESKPSQQEQDLAHVGALFE